MNGPEHYRKAERILDEAERGPFDETALAAVGIAQAHATLARAAAAIDAAAHANQSQVDYLGQWWEALS